MSFDALRQLNIESYRLNMKGNKKFLELSVARVSKDWHLIFIVSVAIALHCHNCNNDEKLILRLRTVKQIVRNKYRSSSLLHFCQVKLVSSVVCVPGSAFHLSLAKIKLTFNTINNKVRV